MKRILLVLIFCSLVNPVFAKDKLWVKVVSNDVNNVWIEFDETFTGQRIDRKLLVLPARFLTINSGLVIEKSNLEKLISDLPDKYKKTDGSGKWVEKTIAEKRVADAAEQLLKKTNLKKAENKAVQTFRDAGVMTTNDLHITSVFKSAYADYLETLSDSQQDNEMRKLDKSLTKINWNGGNEKDIWWHPDI